MARRSPARTVTRKPTTRRKRRFHLPRLWPSARWRRRLFKAFKRVPGFMQLVIGITLVGVLALALNWAYQVIRKPSELFFPVSGALYKTPAETWQEYAPIFRNHSTNVITPELLAALAQVEGSGNPLVRTYWRWSFTRPREPFSVYRPASSAVGMYQITDGTFAEARHYCIHNHRVVEDGPWDEPRSCWLNSLYMRVVPSHAVELTSAYLHVAIATILTRQHIANATAQQQQDLAAVIHLCGAGAGNVYTTRNFRLTAEQHCGDHEVRVYVAQVNAMKQVFTRLRAME
jgi:hypothetical protein